MISKLKNRPRSDRMEDQAAKPRRNWDRVIYLMLLAGFGLALGNYMLGDRLFLRAHGIVLRERLVVAPTALVRVSRVAVRPGQAVEVGDLLFQADSLVVLGRLADLSMQDAGLAEREATLRSELGMAETLLPVATARRAALAARVAELSEQIARRTVTVNRREDVETELHALGTEVLTLTARVEGLEQEIAAVETARAHAAKAIGDLETQYGGGRHLASVTGIVGEDVPDPGEVFRPGEPIVTLLSGDPYVLSYLPDIYLFGVDAGDRVTIANGNIRHTGTIEEVLPVSKSIPEEFRTAFRLDESRQMARVRLDQDARFPTFSPVQVSMMLRNEDRSGPVTRTVDAVLSGLTGATGTLGARLRGFWDRGHRQNDGFSRLS